ncbi:unnamed protein product [Bursaphelenchus okinawaensis]|uniref:Syndecan/Neurexin domain-containing protein n=1 Tax=Bursaphelenchus okinawaensis TaxID=465554 RepID=A0A811LN23_9BILA|nr:unnamed protein product [Bursaphelenchus okinawaensis]CAG9124327.1 unnamed protein product [Bursaphelenchus okinawaensis]
MHPLTWTTLFIVTVLTQQALPKSDSANHKGNIDVIEASGRPANGRLDDEQVRGSGSHNPDDEDGDAVEGSGRYTPPSTPPAVVKEVKLTTTTTTERPKVEIHPDDMDEDEDDEDDDDDDEEYEDDTQGQEVDNGPSPVVPVPIATQTPVYVTTSTSTTTERPTTTSTRRPYVQQNPTVEDAKTEFPFGFRFDMLQPGILAAISGGVVIGILLAILVVMYIVYRIRKKDSGSYPVDEPRQPPHYSYAYQKAPTATKEFYA